MTLGEREPAMTKATRRRSRRRRRRHWRSAALASALRYALDMPALEISEAAIDRAAEAGRGVVTHTPVDGFGCAQRPMRRHDRAEGREPATHGQLQDPRRDEQARRAGCRSRQRRHCRKRRQPRPIDCLRRSSCRRALRDLRAFGRADLQDRSVPWLRRDADRRWRFAGRGDDRGASQGRRRPAWCSATRTTTSTSSPDRRRSVASWSGDVPDLRRVIVPLGGGGLASGIAIAVKGRRPDRRGDRRAGRGVRPVRAPCASRRTRRHAGRRDRCEAAGRDHPTTRRAMARRCRRRRGERGRRRDGAADGAGQALRRGRRRCRRRGIARRNESPRPRAVPRASC